MILFIFKKCIKINSSLLEIKENQYTYEIVNYINVTEKKTKILIFIGSFVFIIYYFSLIFFFSNNIKINILQKTPLINKIFQFYRKLILISLYEERKKSNG